MPRHLLITNDFPPKVGGIQNYLWELWRRLPHGHAIVHTTPHPDAAAFDAVAPMRVVRAREPWLLPLPHLVRRVNRLAEQHEAELVVIDPALPAGLIGPHLDRPYAVIVHGAEAAIPGRLPLTLALLKRVLNGASGVIAAGGYPAAECERALGRSLQTYVIPPGTDVNRFRPLTDTARTKARQRLGIASDALLLVSVSRLVPRKGMDTLIKAAARLSSSHDKLQVVIAGDGRHRRRLARLVQRLNAPVRLAGRLSDAEVAALYGCADVFAMLCRSRWGGLEQEGFGIVFVEAAAAGVPQVAGSSGGAHEAVAHGETGIVLRNATVEAAATAIGSLLDDHQRRCAMGEAARKRAVADFSYDVLSARLEHALEDLIARS